MVIFEQNEQNFDTIGLGTLVPYEAVVSEELNGDFELEIEHPYDTTGKWKRIETGRIILAQTPRGEQPFRIYYHKPNMEGVQVKARHIFYDLLDNICESVVRSGTAQEAMDAIKAGLSVPMPFQFNSDIKTSGIVTGNMENPVSLILKEDWDDKEGETKSFFYSFGGELKRDFFNVSMLESLGSDRGVFIAYRKNLVGLEVTEDISEVATRIYPIGKDGLALDGQYIDSQYVNNYVYPKVKVIEDTKAESQSDLREIAENFFAEGGDIPKVNIKVDFIDISQTEEYKNYANLEKVFLGDTVTVVNQKMGFSKKAKVISYEFDAILGRYNKIELGDFSPTVTSPITRGANAGDIANTAYGKSNNAETLLQQHLKDFNNPHRVTSEQVGGGGTGGGCTILHGTEAPSNYLGSDGDYYIKDEIQGVADEHTLLLLHGEDLKDSSMHGVTFTNNGVSVSNKQSKFGGKSLYFDGSSYLRTNLSNVGINFNQDWTLEWWEMPEFEQDKKGSIICMPNGNNGFVTWYPNGNDARLFAGNIGWSYIPVTVIGTVKPMVWTHRALIKSGNKVYAFENGVKKTELSTSGTLNMGQYLDIGFRNTSSLSSGYTGWVDELRVSNVARWTSDFDPPTEPYTVYQNAEPGELYVKESGKWVKILTGAK